MRDSTARLFAAAAAAMALAGAPAPKPPPVFISPSGEPIRPTAAAPDAFEAWFSRLDAKHDGRIDKAEFTADAVRFFHELDTDGDGVIDGFELASYEKSVAPELDIGGAGFAHGGHGRVRTVSLLSDPEPVSSADLRLDGRITLAEWLEVTDKRFAMLDKKHLGYLTRDDLLQRLPKWARGK